jgi:RNA polymerase sigma factor (TIGR02999 family)
MSAEDLDRKLYEELRRLAARRMASEPSDHTLQPTALVHEAWLRLRSMESAFVDRAHFFASAALAMRRILIDRARRVGRVRHGGELDRVELADLDAGDSSEQRVDMHELATALEQLERRDPELATVITMRYVLGCTVDETADALGVSPAKVKKDVAFAQAWLRRRLDEA